MPALGRSNSPPTPLIPFCPEPYGCAVGVGSQEEDAITEVRGADGCRWNAVPFRSPPARGQIGEDSIEPTRGKQAWDVFHEEDRGSNVANDAPDLIPEPPIVGDACALPGDAVRLAGEAGGHDFHSIGKSTDVDGRDVKIDWSRLQRPVFHASCQDLNGTGVPLAVSDGGGVGHGELDAELEPATP